MRLAYPWVLLALVLLPLLLWARYGARGRVRIRFSNLMGAEDAPRSWAVWLHPLLPTFFALGYISLVLAASRPQFGIEESKSNAEVFDVVLLIDASGSMRGLDISPDQQRITRRDASKKVASDFVKRRTEDRISLIVFGSTVFTLSPLTRSTDFLLEQLNRLEISMAGDETAIGSAIAAGINRLEDSQSKSKVIVLLTDGVNNAGSLEPLDAARVAQERGYRIHTIAVGEDGRVPALGNDLFGRPAVVPMMSEIDTETLRKIADMTGGRFFRARNYKELEKVYADIDTMERTEVEVERFMRYEERYTLPALLALCFLGLELLLAGTRLGRTV